MSPNARTTIQRSLSPWLSIMIKGMAIHLQILRVGIQLNNKRLENVSQAFLRYFVTAFQSNIFKTERFGIRFRLNLATCPPLRASVDRCPDARPTVATTWNTRLRFECFSSGPWTHRSLRSRTGRRKLIDRLDSAVQRFLWSGEINHNDHRRFEIKSDI